jgi:hypothetical protein
MGRLRRRSHRAAGDAEAGQGLGELLVEEAGCGQHREVAELHRGEVDGGEIRGVAAAGRQVGRLRRVDRPDRDVDALEGRGQIVVELGAQQRQGDLGRRRGELGLQAVPERGIAVLGQHGFQELLGAAGEVLLPPSHQVLDPCRVEPPLDVVEGVDTHHGDDAALQPFRGRERHRAAQRMPDQDHPAKVEGQHHGAHVLAQRFDRPGAALAAGLAMTGEVEGDHLAVVAEARDLLGPVAAVAAPAVDEDQRRLAAALGVIADGDAVGGGHGGVGGVV